MKNYDLTIKGTTLLLLALLFVSGCLTVNIRESYKRLNTVFLRVFSGRHSHGKEA